MGRGRGPGQYGQRLTLTGGHDQWGCGIVHANSLPNCGYLFWRHTTSMPGTLTTYRSVTGERTAAGDQRLPRPPHQFVSQADPATRRAPTRGRPARRSKVSVAGSANGTVDGSPSLHVTLPYG